MLARLFGRISAHMMLLRVMVSLTLPSLAALSMTHRLLVSFGVILLTLLPALSLLLGFALRFEGLLVLLVVQLQRMLRAQPHLRCTAAMRGIALQ